MTDEMRVPDGVGVVVAWRTWVPSHVTMHPRPLDYMDQADPPENFRIYPTPSLNSRASWPVGEPLKATCMWHDAPGAGCLCGIHGVTDPVYLIGQPGAARPASLLNGRAVAGQVALWGRMIRHEQGWRAEWGKPLSVVPLWEGDEPPAVRTVRETYGLPLVECPEMAAAVDRAKDLPSDFRLAHMQAGPTR